MTPEQRIIFIDLLVASFDAMPTWAKAACKHAMAAPKNCPTTGKPFTSFREVLEAASNETLNTLKQDFEDNGDLLS